MCAVFHAADLYGAKFWSAIFLLRLAMLDAVRYTVTMEKKRYLVPLLFVAAFFAHADSVFESGMPQAFLAFAEAAYTSVCEIQKISELKAEAVSLSDMYVGSDQLVYLGLCEYISGMDAYFRGQNDLAGEFFDKAQDQISKSLSIERNVVNLSAFAFTLLRNASVKKFSYQIKWVPKLNGIVNEALEKNPDYLQAKIIKFTIQCFIPAPYGSYRKGSVNMESLYNSGVARSPVDDYSMCTCIGYALSKLNDTAGAISWYQAALALFPQNWDTLRGIAELQK